MTPAVVVGIDMSLTCTGIAWIGADGTANTETRRSTGKTADTLAQRSARIVRLAEQITSAVIPGQPVIVESPSHGSAGGAMWDRAGLWWLVVSRLHEMGCPVSQVAPATVKKWITGSGRAEKNTMGVHVGRLFPDVVLGSDDEVDALALAHIAAVRAGFPVPKRAGHTAEGWKAVKWAVAEPLNAVLRPLEASASDLGGVAGTDAPTPRKRTHVTQSTTGAK